MIDASRVIGWSMLPGVSKPRGSRRLLALSVCLGTSAVVTLSGCGNIVNTKIIGSTAMTVSPDGDPVAVIAVCSDYVDEIDIGLGRGGLEEDEENVMVGTWTATEPQSGLVQVNLVNPEPPWQGPDITFEGGVLYIIGAYPADEDMSAGQSALSGAQMTDLEPDTVYEDVLDSDRLTETPLVDYFSETCEGFEDDS